MGAPHVWFVRKIGALEVRSPHVAVERGACLATECLILGEGSASDWSVRRIHHQKPELFRVRGVEYLIVDGLGF
jgi:hypothetical protein